MTREFSPEVERKENNTEKYADNASFIDIPKLEAFTDEEITEISGFIAPYGGLPAQCHLWNYRDRPGLYSQRIRLASESIILFLAVYQSLQETTDILRSGHKKWWKMMSAFPCKVLHKLSSAIILMIVPIRFACALHPFLAVAENVLAVFAILMSSMHFLFYCRGMKFVGPFVVMIYKIVVGDMIRFFLIYLIFIISFCQAFSVVFTACQREHLDRLARNEASEYSAGLDGPFEGLMRMFIMSAGEFSAFYKNLNECNSSLVPLGKILFFIYELLVAVMLLNLLIAMMTRTYEKVAETQKEWKRQWAQVILMLEQSLQPRDRLISMLKYSRPIRSDKMHRSFVVRQRLPSKGKADGARKPPTEQRAAAATKEYDTRNSINQKLLTFHSTPMIRRLSAQSPSEQSLEGRGGINGNLLNDGKV